MVVSHIKRETFCVSEKTEGSESGAVRGAEGTDGGKRTIYTVFIV